MKKFILLVMLISGVAKAQTFDFSCTTMRDFSFNSINRIVPFAGDSWNHSNHIINWHWVRIYNSNDQFLTEQYTNDIDNWIIDDMPYGDYKIQAVIKNQGHNRYNSDILLESDLVSYTHSATSVLDLNLQALNNAVLITIEDADYADVYIYRGRGGGGTVLPRRLFPTTVVEDQDYYYSYEREIYRFFTIAIKRGTFMPWEEMHIGDHVDATLAIEPFSHYEIKENQNGEFIIIQHERPSN